MPETKFPGLQPCPDHEPHEGHHHHTRRVDCYGHCDERQTPSPVDALQQIHPVKATSNITRLSDKRAESARLTTAPTPSLRSSRLRPRNRRADADAFSQLYRGRGSGPAPPYLACGRLAGLGIERGVHRLDQIAHDGCGLVLGGGERDDDLEPTEVIVGLTHGRMNGEVQFAGFSAGGKWIRTSSSPPDSQRFQGTCEMGDQPAVASLPVGWCAPYPWRGTGNSNPLPSSGRVLVRTCPTRLRGRARDRQRSRATSPAAGGRRSQTASAIISARGLQ